MSPFNGTSVRRTPAWLLLGLLALLLWGQCAGLLYPSSPAHYRALVGYASSTDSLPTAHPATLYLTLTLRNELRRPVLIYDVDGALIFNGRTIPFSATAQLHHTPLAAGAGVRQAVAIAVPLPPDSVALLRQILQTDPLVPTGPRLRWQVRYDAQHPPSALTLRTMQPYLPRLRASTKTTGAGHATPAIPR